MSEWITDRLPTEMDTSVDLGWFVWTCYEGQVKQWSYDGITLGRPWQPIVPPEPYVKPKRWRVVHPCIEGYWKLKDADGNEVHLNFLYEIHEEAAERIAAIYEEVMP